VHSLIWTADDISLLAELLELLLPALEIFQEEAAPLDLEVNTQKKQWFKHWTLSSLCICGHDV